MVRLSRIEALKGSVGAEDHHSELRSGVWASYGWGGQRADQVGYECSARNGIRFSESGFGQSSLPDFGQTSFLTDASQKLSDFGGALGGPLKKDRLFIFGDYRGVRRSSDGTVLLTVPTKTVHDTCLGPASPSTNCDLSQYKQGGASFNQPFSTGLIPNSQLSPQMLPFLQMVPLPNAGTGLTNNFIDPGVDTFTNDNVDVRSDYFLSADLKVFGRYSFANFTENGTPAFGRAGGLGTNPNTFAGRMKDRNQGISAGFSYNLTPSLLTDFRFGFFRYNLTMDSLDVGTTPATQAGINGLNLPGDVFSSGMPYFHLLNPNITSLPIAGNIDFLRLGYSSAANSCDCPLRQREQQFQFVSNWTKVEGKHRIRWGADINYLQNYLLNSDTRRAGHLQFGSSSTSGTGFVLGDFLLGTVASFNRSYNPTVRNAGERQKRLFFYGEDTWRITSRLTLNYGLRWEIYLPQSVTGTGNGGWLRLGSGSSPANDQFLVAGQARTNLQGNVSSSWTNIGPRLGLAYLMNPSTVIRAGYARAFDPGYAGTIFGVAPTQSPPVGVVATINSGFTINSTANPKTTNPFSICVAGSCTVPPFVFLAAPFTLQDLSNANLITTQIPLPTGFAQVPQQANLYVLPHRLRLPTVDSWNIAIQHELNRNMYMEIAYVGNKGTHVLNMTRLIKFPITISISPLWQAISVRQHPGAANLATLFFRNLVDHHETLSAKRVRYRARRLIHGTRRFATSEAPHRVITIRCRLKCGGSSPPISACWPHTRGRRFWTMTTFTMP